MRRVVVMLLFPIIMGMIFSAQAGATVIQYNNNGYQTPNGWNVIATQPTIDLDHYYFYYWGINDLGVAVYPGLTQVNIVFHDIYNWQIENNWVNLYVKDDANSLGWLRVGKDNQSLAYPDWSAWGHLGVWSDPTDVGETNNSLNKYDVVFTITNPVLLAYLSNGNDFVCVYR